VHFVPVTITTIVMMPFYVMSGPEKIATWERWSASGLTGTIAYLDPFKYVSGIAYSAATALHLVRHGRDVEHGYSNIESVNLHWLFRICAATGGIWVLVTALKIAHVSTAMRDGHVAIAMALLVYGIGYMGLRQPEVFRYETADVPVQTREVESAPATAKTEASAPRYEHSSISDAEAMQLREALLTMMERDQPWKESELTLPDLASRLRSTPHKLSLVLNSQLGQTFYDFVNGYRVREVQRRIRAGDARALKMLALAMDAGFASKSAFNETFKKHTSQTPSAFRQAVGAH
jgi:AraC-like DNA-binding protein